MEPVSGLALRPKRPNEVVKSLAVDIEPGMLVAPFAEKDAGSCRGGRCSYLQDQLGVPTTDFARWRVLFDHLVPLYGAMTNTSDGLARVRGNFSGSP